MQLQPGEIFTIVRQIADPSDTATYYVRAYIRNSRTDAILATVNLAAKGSQRYTKEWTVPQDVSGQGFYVDIETHVFTDSGYTQESNTYGVESNQYLVAKRILLHEMNQMLGGADVSYDKIRTIVREVMAEAPEETPVDLSPVLRMCENMMRKMEKMDEASAESATGDDAAELKAMVKALAPAFESLKQGIAATTKAVRDIKIPEQKEVDLTPVLDHTKMATGTAMDVAVKEMRKDFAAIVKGFEELQKTLKDATYVQTTTFKRSA